jgi:hypothetical protein
MIKTNNCDAKVIAEMLVDYLEMDLSLLGLHNKSVPQLKNYLHRASIIKAFCISAGLPNLAERVREK